MHPRLALAALTSTVLASPRSSPVAAPNPQGVGASIAPTSRPEECAPTYMNGAPFQIGIVNASTAASRMIKRQTNPNTLPANTLILTVRNGKLTDQDSRQGYIASNNQLQFDPVVPQAGALYTTGFSICSNGTLALATAIWYECLSGDFYNIYTQPTGGVCYPAYLGVLANPTIISTAARSIAATSTAASSSTTRASQLGNGPISSTSPLPNATFTTVISTSVSAVSQIRDGQIQAPTAASVMVQTIAIVSQIADGQIQAPTSASRVYYTVPPVARVTASQGLAPTNGSITPFNPNAAAAIPVSRAGMMALVAAAVGLSVLAL